MKIDLTELLREVGNETDFEKEEEVSFPKDGLVLTRPVKISLHLVNAGYAVLLTGKLSGEAELGCSRCLKKIRQPLEVELSEEYARASAQAPQTSKVVELKEKDFIYPLGKDNLLDVTELIRENMLLSLPISPLCQETCKGV